jgi:hypothetical protein
MKTNQVRMHKTIFSEFAEELATVTSVLANTQQQAEKWESLQ